MFQFTMGEIILFAFNFEEKFIKEKTINVVFNEKINGKIFTQNGFRVHECDEIFHFVRDFKINPFILDPWKYQFGFRPHFDGSRFMLRR